MKRPIIMTTAEFEKPARASLGVSTLVTSSNANELSATMSERTLSAIKATMVSRKTPMTMLTCPACEVKKALVCAIISPNDPMSGVR